MMADVDQRDKRSSFIEPDNPNIHIDAELKQVIRSLDLLRSQRKMQRVFDKNGEFTFEQVLFFSSQFLYCF